MTEFEQQTSGTGSDRSANRATTLPYSRTIVTKVTTNLKKLLILDNARLTILIIKHFVRM